MGKGDKRTKRGKINSGSFGNSRKKAKKTKAKIVKRPGARGAQQLRKERSKPRLASPYPNNQRAYDLRSRVFFSVLIGCILGTVFRAGGPFAHFQQS